MFPFSPMTPEERAEAEKEAASRRAKGDRIRTAALPHLREAQRSLREATALGCDGSDLFEARQSLAKFIENVETDLVRPL